jgi:hypothetical protein
MPGLCGSLAHINHDGQFAIYNEFGVQQKPQVFWLSSLAMTDTQIEGSGGLAVWRYTAPEPHDEKRGSPLSTQNKTP